MIGKQIREWIFLEEIGRGGMGIVYKAKHALVPDQFRAIKVIHSRLMSEEKNVTRFLRESALMLSLKHPNLPTAEPPFEAEGQLFVVMELLRGASLATWIRRLDMLAPGQAVSFSLQAAEALAHTHDHGICHRDIKPSNLFIEDNGTVKLLDFGLARRFADAGITSSGLHVGTLEYLPPEIFYNSTGYGSGDVDEDTWLKMSRLRDIYALGLVLFVSLSGELPFDVPAKAELVEQIQALMRAHKNPLPSIREYRMVPNDLERVISRATSHDPNDRYQSAHEFADALRSMSETLPYVPLPHWEGLQNERVAEPGRAVRRSPIDSGDLSELPMDIPEDHEKKGATESAWTLENSLDTDSSETAIPELEPLDAAEPIADVKAPSVEAPKEEPHRETRIELEPLAATMDNLQPVYDVEMARESVELELTPPSEVSTLVETPPLQSSRSANGIPPRNGTARETMPEEPNRPPHNGRTAPRSHESQNGATRRKTNGNGGTKNGNTPRETQTTTASPPLSETPRKTVQTTVISSVSEPLSTTFSESLPRKKRRYIGILISLVFVYAMWMTIDHSGVAYHEVETVLRASSYAYKLAQWAGLETTENAIGSFYDVFATTPDRIARGPDGAALVASLGVFGLSNLLNSIGELDSCRVAFALLAAWLLYMVFRFIHDRIGWTAGILAASLLATSPFFFEFSHRALPAIAVASFFFSAYYFAKRAEHNILYVPLFGLCFGMAAGMWAPLLMTAPLFAWTPIKHLAHLGNDDAYPDLDMESAGRAARFTLLALMLSPLILLLFWPTFWMADFDQIRLYLSRGPSMNVYQTSVGAAAAEMVLPISTRLAAVFASVTGLMMLLAITGVAGLLHFLWPDATSSYKLDTLPHQSDFAQAGLLTAGLALIGLIFGGPGNEGLFLLLPPFFALLAAYGYGTLVKILPHLLPPDIGGIGKAIPLGIAGIVILLQIAFLSSAYPHLSSTYSMHSLILGAGGKNWPLGVECTIGHQAAEWLNRNAPDNVRIELTPHPNRLEQVLRLLQWSGKLRSDIKPVPFGEGDWVLASFSKSGQPENPKSLLFEQTYGRTLLWQEKSDEDVLAQIYDRAVRRDIREPSMKAYPLPDGPYAWKK